MEPRATRRLGDRSPCASTCPAPGCSVAWRQPTLPGQRFPGTSCWVWQPKLGGQGDAEVGGQVDAEVGVLLGSLRFILTGRQLLSGAPPPHTEAGLPSSRCWRPRWQCPGGSFNLTHVSVNHLSVTFSSCMGVCFLQDPGHMRTKPAPGAGGRGGAERLVAPCPLDHRPGHSSGLSQGPPEPLRPGRGWWVGCPGPARPVWGGERMRHRQWQREGQREHCLE